jgi:hypothetical protein
MAKPLFAVRDNVMDPMRLCFSRAVPSKPFKAYTMTRHSKLLFSIISLVLSIPAFAQDAQTVPVRLRGTIEAADKASISVRTREGTSAQVALTEKTAYSGLKRLQLSDIAPNSYIGVAGRPMAGGSIEALSVLVFPETSRGTGEGHREWDLLPGSSMTNATVTATVASTSGRNLEVSFQGKTAKITVPDTTPIVTYVPATVKDAVPGLAVIVFALRDQSGQLAANRVILEKNGVKPPM